MKKIRKNIDVKAELMSRVGAVSHNPLISRVERRKTCVIQKLRGLTKERHAEEAVLELMSFYGDGEGSQLCSHGLVDGLKNELFEIKQILD